MKKSLFQICIGALFCLYTFTQTTAARELVNPTKDQIRIIHAYLSGSPIDFEEIAREARIVRQANEFDRSRIFREEVERLRQIYNSASEITSIKLSVSVTISEYDGSEGGFLLSAFQAGVHIPYSYGIELHFENYQEFRVWKLDVPSARDVVYKLDGRRELAAEVTVRPFGIDPAAPNKIRSQVLRVLLSDRIKKNTVGEIKTRQELRAIAFPGSASVPQVPNDKLNVMQLQLGALKQDFMDWGAKNNFSIGEEYEFTRDDQNKINYFFADREALEKEITPPADSIRGDMTGNSRFSPLGVDLDCRTKDQRKQVCGRVVLTNEPDETKQVVYSIQIAQVIATSDTKGVVGSLVSKYGNYNDSFEFIFSYDDGSSALVLGKKSFDYRSQHFVWGESFESESKNTRILQLGDAKRSWPIEAIVIPVSGTKTVLIVQINGNRAGAGAKSGEGVAAQPRL